MGMVEAFTKQPTVGKKTWRKSLVSLVIETWKQLIGYSRRMVILFVNCYIIDLFTKLYESMARIGIWCNVLQK